MSQLYEGMFVLDNELVRAGWPEAKSAVTGLVAKHGGAVETARRWAERKLAYPISGRTRATYLLAYYRIPTEGIAGLIRDLDLSETILRYLILRAGEVPAGEAELASAEEAPDFVLPAVPDDSAGAYDPLQRGTGESGEGDGSESDSGSDSDESGEERPRRRREPVGARVGIAGDDDSDDSTEEDD